MTPATLAAILLGALLGCGKVSDWGTPTVQDPVFPHAAGYDAALAHGADYLARGMGACADCHQGTTAPTCAECHADYPHPDGFVDGSLHGGGTWGPEGSTATCDACHAATGTRAATFGCSTCHSSWPHPEGWAEAGQHGPAVIEAGSAVAACGSCHGGEALDGGRVGGACADCHASYPHPAGWADGAVHGAFPGADEPEGAGCGGCHEGAAGGTSGVACSQCHAYYPHQPDHTRAHIGEAGLVGEAPCMRCHAPGDGVVTVAATCAATCHGGVE